MHWSIGPTWHRWDPHIHAPGTLKENQYGPHDDDAVWARFFAKIANPSSRYFAPRRPSSSTMPGLEAPARWRPSVRRFDMLRSFMIVWRKRREPIHRLRTQGRQLKALEKDELPAWLRSVAEVTRSDGRVLLIPFASTLVRHDLSPPWNGQRSWPASRHAVCAIYESLVPKPTLAGFFDRWKRANDNDSRER